MSRIARIVNPGYPHHIVHRGNNKQLIFKDSRDKKIYLLLLKKYSCQCNCKVHTYCLMPNHTHLLLVPDQNTSLAKAMQKISLSYTRYINKKYKRTGRLWECRFFSALIDKESYLWSVCRYIEQNPLRVGMVAEATEYKWSSAKINSGLEEPGFVEPVWKEYLNKNEYTRFLTEGIKKREIKKIRESISRGIPLGSRKFLNKMITQFGKEVIFKIPAKKVSSVEQIKVGCVLDRGLIGKGLLIKKT